MICHECDLLVKNQPVEDGCKVICPRCGHVLYVQAHHTVTRSLAYVVTALLCFYPAMNEPIMQLNMSGFQQSQSIISGTMVLLEEQYYLVAILTFITSMAIPFIRLVLLFIITFSLTIKFYHHSLAWQFRLFYHLEEWGMLEVYMLGIIVSVVKLSGMARIEFGHGLVAYALLLVTSILASTTLNEHEVWELFEANASSRDD
jgi:paraquat-inducible protein A